MRTNKNLSLDVGLVNEVSVKLPDGLAFSTLVERLLAAWLKSKKRTVIESPELT